MKIKILAARVALVAMGLGGLLGAHAASASDEVAEEMVVYGRPTELVLDTASLRVDVKEHARSIGRIVRDALGEKSPEQMAAARERIRG